MKIVGRPLHNKAFLIPSKSYGLEGFEYVVPLVTKETANGDALEGVLLNKGFIPKWYADMGNRMRIEDAWHF